MSTRTAICALALTAFVAACQSTPVGPGAVVDGWELGPPVECEDEEMRDWCAELLQVAERGFLQRNPWHLPIAERFLYGQARPIPRSGGPIVIGVFTLVDGSTRAMGAGAIGIEPPVPFLSEGEPLWPRSS